MSQRLEILRHLSQGRTLTTLEAWTRFRCTTASQRCTELRKQRWPIKSRMVKVGRKIVAEYFIPQAKAALVRRKLAQ